MNIKIDIKTNEESQKVLNFDAGGTGIVLDFEKDSLNELDALYDIIIKNIEDVTLEKMYTVDKTTESVIAESIVALIDSEIVSIKKYFPNQPTQDTYVNTPMKEKTTEIPETHTEVEEINVNDVIVSVSEVDNYHGMNDESPHDGEQHGGDYIHEDDN